MKFMSTREYRRRVFNAALLECFSRIHESCCGDACCDQNGCKDNHVATMANNMAKAFYSDTLKLKDSTVNETKARLSESVTFIKDCVSICEAIADDNAEIVADNDMKIPEEREVELDEEDQEVITTLFDNKTPELQLEKIRDATVNALIAEDKKAQEIKAAVDIAQSQVAAGEDPSTMEETVNRIAGRGPTSLMNAIMNSTAAGAFRRVNEEANGKFVPVGKVMAENATQIRNNAIIMYTLFESSSVFGIVKYGPNDVKKLAESISYEN